MKKKTYSCGIEAAMDLIEGKWKLLILWNLAPAPARFSELRRKIPGVSEKMLIQSLKEMMRDQIVKRRDFREIPPRVEYSLTEFGSSLAHTLVPLCEWGTQHMKRIGNLPARAVPSRRVASGRS